MSQLTSFIFKAIRSSHNVWSTRSSNVEKSCPGHSSDKKMVTFLFFSSTKQYAAGALGTLRVGIVTCTSTGRLFRIQFNMVLKC